jgi:hypothetical protein
VPSYFWNNRLLFYFILCIVISIIVENPDRESLQCHNNLLQVIIKVELEPCFEDCKDSFAKFGSMYQKRLAKYLNSWEDIKEGMICYMGHNNDIIASISNEIMRGFEILMTLNHTLVEPYLETILILIGKYPCNSEDNKSDLHHVIIYICFLLRTILLYR